MCGSVLLSGIILIFGISSKALKPRACKLKCLGFNFLHNVCSNSCKNQFYRTSRA